MREHYSYDDPAVALRRASRLISGESQDGAENGGGED
jgi:hypothetical protein